MSESDSDTTVDIQEVYCTIRGSRVVGHYSMQPPMEGASAAVSKALRDSGIVTSSGATSPQRLKERGFADRVRNARRNV